MAHEEHHQWPLTSLTLTCLHTIPWALWSRQFSIHLVILLLSPHVSSSAPRVLLETAKSFAKVQVNDTHCSPLPAEVATARWHCPFPCPSASLPAALSTVVVTETTWKGPNEIGFLVQLIQLWGLDWIPAPRENGKNKFYLKILLQSHHIHREGFDVSVISFPGIFLELLWFFRLKEIIFLIWITMLVSLTSPK